MEKNNLKTVTLTMTSAMKVDCMGVGIVEKLFNFQFFTFVLYSLSSM